MFIDSNAGDTIQVDRIGPRQVLLLVIGALVVFCDGFDAQTVSAAGPALTADWHLPRQALAPVFAANLAGLMIGAMTITPLADLFSRRTIIMGCVAAFGLLSLLAPFTTTLATLAVVRFATGLALGAAMPSVMAAASEYVPHHLRTRIVVALACAFTFGFAAPGIAAAALITQYGWQAMFWLGGVLALAMLPLVALGFPESPTFLVARGRIEELRRLLARMGPGLHYRPGAETAAAVRRRFPVTALLQDGLAADTVCIWITYFCSGATLYFLANWLPILMHEAGFDITQASLSTTAYHAGALGGAFIVGALADRYGVLALAAWLLAAAFGVALIGVAAATAATFLGASFLAGAFVVGGQNALHAYTSGKLYPSHIRATGLGWALGAVRLGGVLAGSLAAGFVVGLDLGPRNTFLIIGAPEIVAAVALLRIHLNRQRRPATVLAA